MKIKYIPDRGDMVYCSFSPVLGHEQDGRRPALVISRKFFNDKTKMVFLVPITSKIKGLGTEVKIETKKTKGVILIHHTKMVDFSVRNVEFYDKADGETVSLVCEMINQLII